MSETATIEGGAEGAHYTIEHRGECVLIFGPVPMSALAKLTKLAPPRSVIDPTVAAMAGANFAFGPAKDLAALKETLRPGAESRAKKQFAGTGLSDAAIKWLGSGERGISSNTIFTHVTGVDAMGHRHRWKDHPYDPDDLRRCLLLLEQCPEIAAQFDDRMREVSPKWEALVRYWRSLRETFEQEAPNWRDPHAAWDAPRTYQLMKQALGRR